ncbi:MAG: hypothetical protein KDC90_18585, partial [Ignavibacteriae bacterium]|nr:hypothetical protein [Ignavibacteriota bacterium]
MYTRIFGLIANVSQINNAWSVMPISELDGQISGFSAWPWLLFRFWDGYFKFDFYMLTGFLAIGTTLLIIKFKNFSRQIIFNNFTVVYSIFVCIIFYFSYFTNSNVIVRDESIFGVNPNLLLGTLHLILVLIIPL